MKKILGIVVLGLLLSGNSYAKSKLIETKDHGQFNISTFCIDGYKFVVTNKNDFAKGDYQNDQGVSISTSVNTTQFMEVKNGIMVPAKC